MVLVTLNIKTALFGCDPYYIKKLWWESHLKIVLDLHNGKAKAKGWGTDLKPIMCYLIRYIQHNYCN